jgi:cation diffusion facilitator family transporter
MERESNKAIVAAFAANLGIAVAKLVAFFLTGAASMLAESVHSLADTGNQALLVLGGHKADRPPDERHPFGHGQERYFWAFVVALVLFSVGSLFALNEAYAKLRHPHALEQVTVAVAVLVLSAVLESFSLRTAVREASAEKLDHESWYGFIRRTKTPELPAVLLEDTAALCGLGFALAGIVMAEVTGNPRWDAVGGLAIGVLLAVVAGLLAMEMKSSLIGEAADEEVVARARSAVDADPAVRRTIHLRTLQLGPTDLLVAAKVELDPDLSVEKVAAAIDRIESSLRSVVPIARLVFIEPDVFHPEPSAPVPDET